MWVLKIIIPMNEGMLLGGKAKKHNVTIMGYPLSNYKRNGKFCVLTSGFIVGEDKSKSNFLLDLRKDKRTLKAEMSDESFGFFLMEQHPANEIFYNPLIIYTKPAIITNKGDYIFELASWDRKLLGNIAKKIETKLYNGKLIYIRKEKIKSIAITNVLPSLTTKQKRAIELAIENGYYGYPRKIEIEKLANMMGVSYSTFQFHLRNAEKKLIPYIYNSS